MTSLWSTFSSVLGQVNLWEPTPLLGQLTDFARLWYAAPLIIAISLVYGATRHEQTPKVLMQSLKSFLWIMAFVVVIMAVVVLVGFWN
jgi:hypothetical protein